MVFRVVVELRCLESLDHAVPLPTDVGRSIQPDRRRHFFRLSLPDHSRHVGGERRKERRLVFYVENCLSDARFLNATKRTASRRIQARDLASVCREGADVDNATHVGRGEVQNAGQKAFFLAFDRFRVGVDR